MSHLRRPESSTLHKNDSGVAPADSFFVALEDGSHKHPGKTVKSAPTDEFLLSSREINVVEEMKGLVDSAESKNTYALAD